MGTLPAERLPLSDVRPELPAPEAAFIAVGDVMLSRDVGALMLKRRDPDYPFALSRALLANGDFAFGNLETPIAAGRPVRTDEMRFRADPGAEGALKRAGFAVVSLANNHLPDQGERGVEETLVLLDKAGVARTGAGRDATEARAPAFIERGGLRFAFLAYNDDDVVPDAYEAADARAGTAFMREDAMRSAVKAAGELADLVIVSMHSGKEYTNLPNERQKRFARAAIDAGADVVIGHHPHVVQPYEWYKDKLIFYSLGNFVFDQMWSQATRRGLALKLHFALGGLERVGVQPIYMREFARPEPAEGTQADAVLMDFGFDKNDPFFYRLPAE